MEMTAKMMAETLNGREYPFNPTKSEKYLAEKNGLVIMYGHSDDLVEIRGAINDEIGAYEGISLEFLDGERFLECEDTNCPWSAKALEHFRERGVTIEANFGDGEYTWSFEAPFHVERFEILEEGEKFCEGIVFPVELLNVAREND